MSKEHLDQVRAHWEHPDTVSLADQNLRQLEVEAVSAWLDPQKQALDLGCGDGVNSVVFATKVKSLLGVDYSGEMIRRAHERVAGSGLDNLSFRQMSVQDLGTLRAQFNLVISQRCLINLDSPATQMEAVKTVHRLLMPGGVFLMMECFREGLVAINRQRQQLGLFPLRMPWHNQYLSLRQMLPALEPFFCLVAQQDFSLYYLLTRVFSPALGMDHTSQASREMDQAARRMQETLRPELLSGLGPQCLLVFRKRELESVR